MSGKINLTNNIGTKLKEYDDKLRIQFGSILVGCDEAGRGACAGPIVGAAVAFDENACLPGLNDSKQLTYQQRKSLSKFVKKVALAWHIEFIDAPEIDENGLTWANRQVMLRSANKVAEAVNTDVGLYIIDQSPSFELEPHIMLPKADATSLVVAAASVIAKVARDEYMEKLWLEHKKFDWNKSKGYLTDSHKEAIKKYGMIPGIHRFSYVIKDLQKDE